MKPLITLLLFLTSVSFSQNSETTTWILDNTSNIGGLVPSALTELPSVIETPFGKSALFDGNNDGLLLASNPLAGAANFTIEIIFRPDSSTNPINLEQRFLHIRNLANDNRRILIELRLLKRQLWSLDTFIKSENSSLALLDTLDTNKLHSAGSWYHVALVYENGVMQHYINGIKEMLGNVNYLPIDSNGKTSIGARQDPKSWFKGAIRLIRFTKSALKSSEFLKLTTDVKSEVQLPEEIKLYQNYPNPFNPETVISYRLPVASYVTLKVYDVLGREVATLVNELQQPESYNSSFLVHNSSLSSGIYYYSLTAGKFSSVKKMLLIR